MLTKDDLFAVYVLIHLEEKKKRQQYHRLCNYMVPDCDLCINCLDKPRNNGRGIRKKSCIQKQGFFVNLKKFYDGPYCY